MSEDPLHHLPLVGAGGVGGAALELGDVGLPFGLARQAREAGHVAAEVEVVDRIHNHKEAASETRQLGTNNYVIFR